MSADTFVSALFIITAVVAAGILINAVYPIVWSSASTFSSSAHETDTRMRTDFKIVTTYAKDKSSEAQIFIKNIGSNRIGTSEIESSDVLIISPDGLFKPTWTYNILEPSATSGNNFWDTGETLEILLTLDDSSFDQPKSYTFQFILPNGVYRSIEFTPSS